MTQTRIRKRQEAGTRRYLKEKELRQRLDNIRINPVEELKKWNEEQLAFFKLSSVERETLVIREPGILSSAPGRLAKLFSMEEVVFRKKEFDVESDESNHKVVVISKNGKPDSFCWRSGPKQISQGIRYGIIKPESLTGKVISALGGYRKIVNDRIIHGKFVSDKYREKDVILTFSQDRIECFQPIERLMNSYDVELSLEENRKRILILLNECKEKLQARRYYPNAHLLNVYYENAADEMNAFIQEDMDKVDKLIGEVKQAKDKELLQNYTSPTGRSSLMTWTKERMTHVIEQGEYLNTKLTTSKRASSFFRGDIHNCFRDAADIIKDHKADHRNPIWLEHQGCYHSSREPWSVDYSMLGKNKSEIDKTLMAITLIEKDDRIEMDQYGNFSLISPDRHFKKLETTSWTKWASTGSKKQHSFFKRVGLFGWKIFLLFVKLIPRIFYGLSVGLTDAELPSVSSWLADKPEESDDGKSRFSTLSKAMKVPLESLTFRIGRGLGSFIRQVVWESLYGTIIIADVLVDAFKNIKDDRALARGLRDENKIWDQFHLEMQRIKKEKNSTREKINREHENLYKKRLFDNHPVRVEGLASKLAIPSYHLTPCGGQDIFNAFARAMKAGLLTLPRAIPAKHPMIGLVFASTFFIALKAAMSNAVIEPNSYWGQYVQFTKDQAISMSKGDFSSISVGMTQAQVMSGVTEFFIHGRQSWIAELFSTIEKNPEQIFIALLGLYGAGQGLMAIRDFPGMEGLKSIPILGRGPAFVEWLGHKIEEEMGVGTLKWLTFYTATAKISVLLYEIFEIHHHPHDVSKEARLKQLHKEMGALIVSCVEKEQKAYEEDDQIAFLSKILANKHQLSFLNHRTKREMLALTQTKFKDQPTIVSAVKGLLYPEPERSIIGNTFHLIAKIVADLIRVICIPVTGYYQAFPEFLKTLKSFAVKCLMNPISDMIHIIGTTVCIAFRWFFDLVLNKLLGWHDWARKVLTGIDVIYEDCRQILSTPVDSMRKSVSYMDSTHVIQTKLEQMQSPTRQRAERENVVAIPVKKAEAEEKQKEESHTLDGYPAVSTTLGFRSTG